MAMREKLIELIIDSPGLEVLCCTEEEFAKNADWLIARGVTIPKWIPVTERLPEDDGDYLVAKKIFNNSIRQDVLRFAKDGRKVDKYDFRSGWKNVWYYYDSEYGYITVDSVTHWMPLPEPPKEV